LYTRGGGKPGRNIRLERDMRLAAKFITDLRVDKRALDGPANNELQKSMQQ